MKDTASSDVQKLTRDVGKRDPSVRREGGQSLVWRDREGFAPPTKLGFSLNRTTLTGVYKVTPGISLYSPEN